MIRNYRTELTLPDMHGYDVRSSAGGAGEHPHLIYRAPRHRPQGPRRLRADEYMTKPLTRTTLIARITRSSAAQGPCSFRQQKGGIVVNLDAKTTEGEASASNDRQRYQMLECVSLRKGTTLTKEMS